ncbi:hypothetical protein [Bartonella grahamii]|uniref:hypothetical protein n=1 Tax=Bartonella grahamii TaxID=33045 RepID=UPI00117CF33B|nr:hypothetical protein [Bartonella grahamii]
MKKISKKSTGVGFADGSNCHKDKATSLRFSFISWLLLWKEAYLLEIKRAVIRILEPQTQICAIKEDILMNI